MASVSQTTYSSLVGEFVNDAKRVVEDAWQWSSQWETVSVSILSGSTGPYNLASQLNERARVYRVPSTGDFLARCTTSNYTGNKLVLLDNASFYGDKQTYGSTFPFSMYFDKGNSGATSGQSRLRLNTFYPSDGNYTFQIVFHNPQNNLTSDNTEVTAPNDPIKQLAYLYCLYERGEELGEQLTMTESKAKNALADAIATEQASTNTDVIFTNAQ